jgi:RloB-like protein
VDALDEAWVVFDAEIVPHSRAEQATATAESARMRPALSNPCFEVWLLLHAGQEASHLDAVAAKKRCRDDLGIPGPGKKPAVFDDPRLTAPWSSAAEHADARRKQIRADEVSNRTRRITALS